MAGEVDGEGGGAHGLLAVTVEVWTSGGAARTEEVVKRVMRSFTGWVPRWASLEAWEAYLGREPDAVGGMGCGDLLFDHVQDGAGGILGGEGDHITEDTRFMGLREFYNFVEGGEDLTVSG